MRFEETFLQALKLNREEGEARGEKIGIAKAITQMVKEMIKKQMSDDDIMEIKCNIKKQIATETSYTFTGLEQETAYTIKVTTTDKAGNKGKGKLGETYGT